jgi:hypothetical protein
MYGCMILYMAGGGVESGWKITSFYEFWAGRAELFLMKASNKDGHQIRKNVGGTTS